MNALTCLCVTARLPARSAPACAEGRQASRQTGEFHSGFMPEKMPLHYLLQLVNLGRHGPVPFL